MEEVKGKIKWNSQIERILSEEGERALCYSWLHSQSQKRYTVMNNYITIPTIVLSTVAGTASIGSQSLFNDPAASSIGIGVLSLCVSVLNTLASHFGWAALKESHRMTSSSYSKIHRFIMIELSLPRKERMEAQDMLKVVRDQLDRLHENSPQLSDNIINLFKKQFGHTTPDLSKPNITNGLDPIQVHKEGQSPPPDTDRFTIKISSGDRTQDTSQMSSLARPLIESEVDNNHTSS
jgi:hypothetical protein